MQLRDYLITQLRNSGTTGDRRMVLGPYMLLIASVVLVGCSGPRPILYPNDHLKTVGQERAEQDIAECEESAKAAGANAQQGKTEQTAKSTAVGGAVGGASGAVGGAVVGSPGTGAAIGAASGATVGLLRGLFSQSPPTKAYVTFVDRCLVDRGYEPIGWE